MGRTARQIITALMLGLALAIGPTLAAPAAAQAAPNRYAAVCGGQTWTGKDPMKCKGTYSVYKITANRPRLVFQINTTKGVDWEALREGYYAAEKWCSERPIACGIITAVGYAAFKGLWRAVKL